jgi:hypothetical protein
MEEGGVLEVIEIVFSEFLSLNEVLLLAGIGHQPSDQ